MCITTANTRSTAVVVDYLLIDRDLSDVVKLLPLPAALPSGHVVRLGQRFLRLGRLQLLPLLDLLLHVRPPLPPDVARRIVPVAVEPRGQAHLITFISIMFAIRQCVRLLLIV